MNLIAGAPLVLADTNGWSHMGDMGWGMVIFGWVFMTLIVTLVVWLIWSAGRRPEPSGRGGGRALSLLDERYARGAIERDEYLERKSDLEL